MDSLAIYNFYAEEGSELSCIAAFSIHMEKVRRFYDKYLTEHKTPPPQATMEEFHKGCMSHKNRIKKTASRLITIFLNKHTTIERKKIADAVLQYLNKKTN